MVRIGRDRRRALAEALVALTAASLAIRVMPFRRAVRFGARPLPRAARIRVDENLADLGWAVEALSLRLPWRVVCFQKGVALQWMLRRRGIDAQLHYGVGKDEADALRAHVWVEAGEVVMIGGEEKPDFRSVAMFPGA